MITNPRTSNLCAVGVRGLRRDGRGLRRFLLLGMYAMATIQIAGCYFTLVRPYINTALYESGKERLPFQTRLLMMPLMRWAHHSGLASTAAGLVAHSQFWYLRAPEPEAVVQLWVNLASLVIAGLATYSIYCAASSANKERGGLLSVLVYPLFLLLFANHYILHTIQNFRFIYDLPSLAFFSVGLWLIYFRKHPLSFAALFIVATLNRETTLLLLPFFMLSEAVREGKLEWRRAFSRTSLAVVVPLTILWAGWHVYVFHIFRSNVSEYYPRVSLNLYTFVHPRYWPQLLSAGGFLVPFVFLCRRSIRDPQLRAWMWAFPAWFGFMFFWGILVETRVFGELLPYLTCLAVLAAEDWIASSLLGRNRTALAEPVSEFPEFAEAEEAVAEEAAA